MNTRVMIVALLAAAGAASGDTLNCGPTSEGGTRGTMIDLRNDGTSPIRLDSLDFIYNTGSAAPASYNVTFQAWTSPGGWTPNQNLPANWTLAGEHNYDLTGPTGSIEHFTLNGFVLNPGQTIGFAFFSLIPSNTNTVRTCGVQLIAPTYTNGVLTAIPGAIVNNLTFQPNSFGIGMRMYTGSVNYTVLTGTPCYANCDASTIAPILNVNDFTCFINQYAAASSYANCDASTAPPVLNVNDFTCFINRYAAGCPG